MKKFISSLLCIVLLIGFPVACAPKNNASKEKSNEIVESIDDASFLFSSNRLVTENQTVFIDLIKDNPIDEAYHSEKCDETTQGMIKIEVQFAEIWKEELEYSCESFTSHLNENDKNTFNDIQDDWESYISNSYMFLGNVFNNEKYQAYNGQLFLVESASEYRNAIRQRTLYVKYLEFCLTSNGTDSKEQKVEFEWE